MVYLATVVYVRDPEKSYAVREDAHLYRCPRHGRFAWNSTGLTPEPM